jgi:glutathione S-transferase
VRDHGSDSLRKGLQTLDSVWLADKAFMAGDTLSAADLLVACQIEMLR